MPESYVPVSDSPVGQFRLSGAWNFRDVGGARTVDGRAVRGGVLYRSSELSRLDDAGGAELTRLGIVRVFDLRGAPEIERSGRDRVPHGVAVHNLPFDDRRRTHAPHEVDVSVEQAQRQYMMRAYTSFPSLDGAKRAINGVASALTHGDGPALVHCAAGKDRAGWTVATILRAVGVTEEDVLADYLASNDAIEPLRAHVQAVWERGADGAPVELSDAVLGVTEEYYRRGFETVDSMYGSFDGYLDALGFDGDSVSALNAVLLDARA
ncbi:tyrosine-protein phosphatase [Rhodococcoides yunnanense]|jgi:protein tyrosine/serine phosphatase|uniref:tyrosine-protein phosphatase n=1 Tax=Rhodococcoides yunnanense TaxID=278209 RepID=UPI0022B08CD4|nr:tyrosine-protein phosphatase [Rhodococcus yunnanensis]MCZ4277032.1 tyrosine-protein phosphatase [Rhodococcus yunnanensis]